MDSLKKPNTREVKLVRSDSLRLSFSYKSWYITLAMLPWSISTLLTLKFSILSMITKGSLWGNWTSLRSLLEKEMVCSHEPLSAEWAKMGWTESLIAKDRRRWDAFWISNLYELGKIEEQRGLWITFITPAEATPGTLGCRSAELASLFSDRLVSIY